MPFAEATDGCRLHYEVHGPADRPALLIGYPWTDGMAYTLGAMTGEDEMVATTMAANRALVEGFAETYRVVHMDYPRGLPPSEGPLDGDLRADTVASDYVAIADAAGVDRFVALGYSWSGNAALQVASRTDRCAGVAIGGWPPLSGPYAEILGQLQTMIAELEPDDPVRAFQQMIANYYDSIVGHWDEEAAVAALSGVRISFFGADDVGVPELGLPLALAELTRSRRSDLERLGWTVAEIPGHDHMTASLDVALVIATVTAALGEQTW